MAVITVDTRQQANKHELKHNELERMGHTLVRSKLYVGDYALVPTESVDTKRSIAELAQDIWQDHDRFRRELVAAQDAGTHLTILVENTHGIDSIESLASYRESQKDCYKRHGKRPISGMTLAKACKTMQKTYSCTFMFCAPDEAASIIENILIGGENVGNGTRHVADDGSAWSSNISDKTT